MKTLIVRSLPVFALTAVSFATAAQAAPALDATMSCKSEHTSIAISEEYSFQDGYYALGGSASLGGQESQKLANIKTNLKVGQRGVATIFSFVLNGETVVLNIPQRTYLSFEADQVEGKIKIGNKTEVAVCSSVPLR